MLGVTNNEYFFEKLLNKMDLSEKKFFVNMGFSLMVVSVMVFFPRFFSHNYIGILYGEAVEEYRCNC